MVCIHVCDICGFLTSASNLVQKSPVGKLAGKCKQICVNIFINIFVCERLSQVKDNVCIITGLLGLIGKVPPKLCTKSNKSCNLNSPQNFVQPRQLSCWTKKTYPQTYTMRQMLIQRKWNIRAFAQRMCDWKQRNFAVCVCILFQVAKLPRLC